ncbi:MAG: hypothetical protein L0Z62_40780 [Gemmataceae bacterium]|nr:hypothetical protein [Gemmataceae bacterium]
MPLAQRPAAIGLMLCDHVLFEQGTQKPSLIGIFTGVAVEHFPGAPRFDVFAALTDGLGAGIIDLVVIRLDTDEQIEAQSMEFTFPDPLKVVNLRFRFRRLTFPAPGTYVFALHVDGEEIAHRRVRVYHAPEPS